MSEFIHDKVQELKRLANRLIPVAEALVELIQLRARFAYDTDDHKPLISLSSSIDIESLKDVAIRLNNLGSFQKEALSIDDKKIILAIEDDVKLAQERLQSLFKHSIIPIAVREELTRIAFSQIGHDDLREESEVHCQIISKFLDSINITLENKFGDSQVENKNGENFLVNILIHIDLLDDYAVAIIGAMTAIELRKIRVETLALQDKARKNKIVKWISLYIVGSIAFSLVVLIAIFSYKQSEFTLWCGNSLSTCVVPILKVPFQVIIWSFIGSFAATLYRFNRQSIYQFSDLIKWMFTRHVQGIVLGSVFYLVIVSGISILSGNGGGSTGKETKSDELILILSFLIGFSDRFVDGVFNTLIDRYTPSKASDGNKKRRKVIRRTFKE